MQLFVFNPEHDIALAHDKPHCKPPAPALRLRADMGYLPVVWAVEGDLVLVDDLPRAMSAMRRAGLDTRARLVDEPTLAQLLAQPEYQSLTVRPWGWDRAVKTRLARLGVPTAQMPSDEAIARQRTMSHRAWAASRLLPRLTALEGCIGEAWQIASLDELTPFLARHDKLMVKAPWSSSGRGVRRIDPASVGADGKLIEVEANRLGNIINRQGSLMVEPYYDRVEDLAMEFESDGKGTVRFLGLSLFTTHNGAYTGNLILSEDEKRRRIGTMVSLDLLDEVERIIADIMAPSLRDLYDGMFGVDMMVVRHDSRLLLHPCVELNLRTTMGHVALSAP